MNNENYTLTSLIKQGGILYNIDGSDKKEIISNIISALPPTVLSANKRDDLLQAVMEREALISTGIENGIALPHPRTPPARGALLEEGDEPFVTIAFLKQPADWGTPDGSLVHTIFLIVSNSPKQHLNALTKINFLCMNDDFYNLIMTQVLTQDQINVPAIIAAVEEAEKGWRK